VHVVDTQTALDGITRAIVQIHDMSRQMAVASNQQTHVAEDISRQITSIASVSDQNAELAQHSARTGREMEQTAQALHTLVARFHRCWMPLHNRPGQPRQCLTPGTARLVIWPASQYHFARYDKRLRIVPMRSFLWLPPLLTAASLSLAADLTAEQSDQVAISP